MNEPHSVITGCGRGQHTSSPVPPPGELDETYSSSLILAHSLRRVKTRRYHKTEVRHLLMSKENRATDMGNMHRKFGEIWTCGWFLRYASRQTDRRTDIQADIQTY